MSIKTEKLTFWQKLGYGVGDIYGGGSGTLISFFYLVFLVDVVRISPGLAGTVILISKVYDSITDPFEGVISDRTRTPMGRRRPYLLAGIFLVFLSFFLLFYPVAFESEAGRFAFVIFVYLFFSTVVSIVMLNYNALQAELTLDYNERTELTTFRIFFSTLFLNPRCEHGFLRDTDRSSIGRISRFDQDRKRRLQGLREPEIHMPDTSGDNSFPIILSFMFRRTDQIIEMTYGFR